MKRVLRSLAWVSVAGALVGFFLPWARIDVREPELVKQLREQAPLHGALDDLTQGLGRVAVKVRRGTQTITGDLPALSDLPKHVSGAQIPQIANQKNAQVAIALVELFTTTRQDIGLKSYAVYLLPGIALLCGLLLTFLGRRLDVAIGIAILCAAIAGAGFWKLLTANTQVLFVAITIGPGLWLSLWAYVGLAVAAGLSSLPGRAGRRVN